MLLNSVTFPRKNPFAAAAGSEVAPKVIF